MDQIIEQELLLLSPAQFRTYHPIPASVDDATLIAELHLVNQVVARRILGSLLFEGVCIDAAFDTPTDYAELLTILRPTLASWAFVYALPHLMRHLSPEGQEAHQLRTNARQQAEAWTQRLVDHLTANSAQYLHYTIPMAARSYLSTPKVMF